MRLAFQRTISILAFERKAFWISQILLFSIKKGEKKYSKEIYYLFARKIRKNIEFFYRNHNLVKLKQQKEG